MPWRDLTRDGATEPELDAAAGLGFARAALDADLAGSRGLAPGSRVRVYAEQRP